jgi:hypothetical protein
MKYSLLFLGILLFLGLHNENCTGQVTSEIQQADSIFLATHSPTKASLYSAIVPGLGQAYNKKYWKIPLLFAGAVTLYYFYDLNQSQYIRFKTAYIKRFANDPGDKDEFWQRGLQDLSQYKLGALPLYIDYYRRNRDWNFAGFCGLYLLNIIDATVDAYFFDYDISQDLSLKVKPTLFLGPNSTNLGLTCSFKF